MFDIFPFIMYIENEYKNLHDRRRLKWQKEVEKLQKQPRPK